MPIPPSAPAATAARSARAFGPVRPRRSGVRRPGPMFVRRMGWRRRFMALCGPAAGSRPQGNLGAQEFFQVPEERAVTGRHETRGLSGGRKAGRPADAMDVILR